MDASRIIDVAEIAVAASTVATHEVVFALPAAIDEGSVKLRIVGQQCAARTPIVIFVRALPEPSLGPDLGEKVIAHYALYRSIVIGCGIAK